MNKKYFYVVLATVVAITLVATGFWNFYQSINNSSQNNKTKPRLQNYISNTQTTYRLPGEFEKQQAIWMQWPSDNYETGDRPVGPTFINIIKNFAPYIRVNVATVNNNEIANIKNSLKLSGYSGTNVHYYNINHLSIWARDVGPVFLKDNHNNFYVANFDFNNYSRDGDPYYINVESQVHKIIAQMYGFPLVSTNLVSEGGSMESNGKGTLMLTESVSLKRNPKLEKAQIENHYKTALGLKKIIWLKKGLAEDDNITSGHINEIARFANANTILLGQVLPGDRNANSYSKESYLRLEENYNILKNSTDQDGKPFKIIRVPMPPTLYNVNDSSGRLPVRSYLNYSVTNGAVLMQTYWKAGRSSSLKATEDGVKEIFKEVFPGRNIMGIYSENINLWGGGIHCVTQQMPA